jgi:putative photosynthetic complex assembly protein 2
VRGFNRFLMASETILWHEIGLLGGFVLVAGLGWGSENFAGFGVYGILWAMRLCAKLNIFFGVPNAPVSFLPAHLTHLASYFRSRPMNPLFPITITAASAFGGVLLAATSAATTDGAAVGLTILTTLMALGILEQWLLILPMPAESLWKWGMRSRALPTAIIEVPIPSMALSSYRDANHKGSEQ